MTDEDRQAPDFETFFRALERRGQERFRAVLNLLTESTFFYREDHPDLFLYLLRNRGTLRQFFEQFFGWRLYADRQCARLIKERHYNDRVRPSQRALFDLRRRDECFLFALLLEFHEEEARRQNVSPEDEGRLRFLLSDFVSFSLRRFREELGDACPPESRIFEAVKPLFQQLDRHRFVRVVDRKAAEAGEELPAAMEEHVLCEFLPGIRCYDASQAARDIVVQAYRTGPEEDAAPAEEAGPAGEGAGGEDGSGNENDPEPRE
jgi:hypothetical protein